MEGEQNGVAPVIAPPAVVTSTQTQVEPAAAAPKAGTIDLRYDPEHVKGALKQVAKANKQEDNMYAPIVDAIRSRKSNTGVPLMELFVTLMDSLANASTSAGAHQVKKLQQ